MFELINKEEIENLGTGYVYRHNTGCRLIYVENDDNNRVFTIGFNTLPENDKGIAHIVEHCVLCGSENYNVKDPFNILDKGSVHTYLNAMTYCDKTVYPVGSTNEADFKKLMDVYCDAVFRPLMYKNEGIFRQEGWNSDGKEYNGIVLNEMKGVYSDPSVVLSETINREMFKGCGYSYNSGGDPKCITDLSYDEFIEFHKKHYHPSNCVIYLYGNIDINEYMKVLDEKYLCNYEYSKRQPFKPVKVNDNVNVELRYNTTGKNILTALYNTGDTGDDALCALLGILSTLWCYTEGGNIKEALLNNGLGDKVSCVFDDSGMTGVMEITVENSDEKDTCKFRKVLNETFKNIAENGVDEYKFKGVVNSMKFFFKEEDFGYKPKGLFYGISIMNSFLKGRENFDCVRINKMFEKIEKMDIKSVAKKYFVNKGSFGILIADKNVSEPIKKVCEKNNETLVKYQLGEDDPQEVRKLMASKVSDISKKGFKIKFEREGENVYVPLENGDIVYCDIYIDVSRCENVKALSAYKAAADVYNEKLANDIDYYMGGFSIEVTSLENNEGYRPVMLFRLKCLKENINKSIDIFREIVSQDISDVKRVSRLMSEARQNIRNIYIESGHLKAVREALAQVSAGDRFENKAGGTEYYSYLAENAEVITEDIAGVKSIFKRGNCFYAFACGEDDRNEIRSIIENALSDFEKGGMLNIISENVTDVSRGIIIDSNVNFNAAAFKMDCANGISRVAQQIISREYIWDKIRLEGGAYGGGCVFGRRQSYMYSYRDPGFENTFNVLKGAGEYLASSKYTQEDIDRFIIGTINEIDRPVKKHSLTRTAMRKAFNDEGNSLVLKRREQILSAVPKDIVNFGERLMNTDIKGICSVGMEKDIKNSHIFKELYTID